MHDCRQRSRSLGVRHLQRGVAVGMGRGERGVRVGVGGVQGGRGPAWVHSGATLGQGPRGGESRAAGAGEGSQS
jgi:hypothetical protein